MCTLCIAIKEKAHRRIDMQSFWVCLRIEKLLVFRHALRRISTGCFTIDYHFSNLNRPKSQFCKKKLQGQALCFLPPRDKKKIDTWPSFLAIINRCEMTGRKEMDFFVQNNKKSWDLFWQKLPLCKNCFYFSNNIKWHKFTMSYRLFLVRMTHIFFN